MASTEESIWDDIYCTESNILQVSECVCMCMCTHARVSVFIYVCVCVCVCVLKRVFVLLGYVNSLQSMPWVQTERGKEKEGGDQTRQDIIFDTC